MTTTKRERQIPVAEVLARIPPMIETLHRVMADESDVIVVGDRLRFSVELLRAFYERRRHRSPICEVERIVRGPDGVLTVWLKSADWQDDGG